MESYIHLYETNDEFTEAYNGPDYVEPWLSLTVNTMTIGYSKILTAITFNSITWVTDIPATGGTATKDNCTFKVYANYDNGSFLDISSDAIVTGELIVAETTATTRQSAGQLTLTASYGDFTATGNVTVYQEAAAPDFSTEPLTFKITSGGTIYWSTSNRSVSKTIDYKLNDGEWKSITSNTGESVPTITVKAGDKVQFRGNNAQYCDSASFNMFSGSTAEFEVEGNIMSLINSENFATLTTLESGFTFIRLFTDCTGLTSAENLILPATKLADYCYARMFQGCTSLKTAPALPATTLAKGCYQYMFQGCTSLKTAPALPATTLAEGCYQYMFQGCTSLKTAPALPATTLTLAEGCYQYMFQGCTSLTTAPELPATTLVRRCYSSMFQGCTSLKTAPALPATTLASNCYRDMFYGCTSLTSAPALPATELKNRCYYNMFDSCTSLTTAPELPATKLAYGCYASMFQDCTSLNYIKCLATDISASNCTGSWVDGVASTGTFVKNPDMISWPTGGDGIPSGWTVQNAS